MCAFYHLFDIETAENSVHIVQTLIIRRILQRRIWLVDCFGFNGPLIQYFSLYNGPSPKERNDR